MQREFERDVIHISLFSELGNLRRTQVLADQMASAQSLSSKVTAGTQ